ncbi:MAG: C25 family cysteine peptidase [Fibrobacterota bacterium]
MTFSAIVLLFLFSFSFAETQITGSLSRDGTTIMQFVNPGYSVTDTLYNNKTYSMVSSKTGPAVTLDKGAPELPVTSTALRIDNLQPGRITISDTSYTERSVSPILPSPGNIAISQRDTAHRPEGSVYSQDAWYPANIIEQESPYTMHGAHGVAISIHPFQYNPAQGKIRIIDSVTFAMEKTTAAGPASEKTSSPSRSFSPVLESRFLNNSAYAPQNFRDTPDRMIIVTPAKYMDALKPLVTWKNQRGLKTEVVEYTNQSVEQLISLFRQEYTSAEGLSYGLIVGDFEDIPAHIDVYQSDNSTERVPADPVYGMLEGDNNYPDIFIGRISAETAQHVENYVQKALRYEKYPDPRENWYAKTVGIGSDEGNPSDIAYIRHIMSGLRDYGFTTLDSIYQGINGNEASFSQHLNEGRSLVNYMGHGYPDGYSFSGNQFRYTSSHVSRLTNQHRLPWIIPLACNVGSYRGRTCISEVWIRKADGGAIVSPGSSPLMDWSPPQTAQLHMNTLIESDDNLSIGAMFYAGLAQMLDTDGRRGNKTARTWVYFGDPSLYFFSAQPEEISITHPDNFGTGDNTISIDGTFPGALISIYGENSGILAVKEATGRSETISFTADNSEDSLYITVTGKNRVPYQDVMYAGMRHELSLDTENGEISTDPDGSHFEEGTEVTLTALPEYGFEFSHWSGDLTGSSNPATIIMDSDKSVSAHFEEGVTYTLSVTGQNGSVSVEPDYERYEEGEEVTLHAAPDMGYIFGNWEGDRNDEAASITVIMDEDMSLQAAFEEHGYVPMDQADLSIADVSSEDEWGDGRPARNVLDGDSETAWFTHWEDPAEVHPHEIVIKTQSPVYIGGLQYTPRQDSENGRIDEYEVYVSTDGENWEEPHITGRWENSTDVQEAAFHPGVVASYIRLIAKSEVNGEVWASAADIDVLYDPQVSRIEKISAAPVVEIQEALVHINRDSPVTIQLHSVNGRAVSTHTTAGSEVVNLRETGVSTGVYILRILDEAGTDYLTRQIYIR